MAKSCRFHAKYHIITESKIPAPVFIEFIKLVVKKQYNALYATHLIFFFLPQLVNKFSSTGAQWLSGRVLDSRPKGRGFEPHRRHCVVVLEQDTFILA